MASKEPLLRPEEVAEVLSADDAKLAPPQDAPASPVYHLRKPVAIAAKNEAAASRRLASLAGGLGEALSQSLEAQITLEVQGFRQELAGVALDTLPQPACLLSFLCAGGGGLGLALDPSCALALVELALGGAGTSSAAGRTPTLLESRILSTLAEDLAQPLSARSGVKFQSGAFGAAGLPPGLAMHGEILGVGLLEVRIADKERSALLLASPALLEEQPLADAKRPFQSVGPLAARLARVPFEVRPVLRAGAVPLSDLTNLEPGTILSLDASEGALLDLRVAGLTLYAGHVTRQPSGSVFQLVWRRGRRETAAGKVRT